MVDLPELPSESTDSIGAAVRQLEESFQEHRAERLKQIAEEMDSVYAKKLAFTELKLTICAYADLGVEWDALLPLISNKKLTVEDMETIQSAHRVGLEEWEMSRYIYDCTTPEFPVDASGIQRNIYHLIMSNGSMRRFDSCLLHGMLEGKLASEIRRHPIEILREELSGLEKAGCFKSFDVGAGKFWGIPVLPPDKESKCIEEPEKDTPQEETPKENSEDEDESEDSPTSPPEISPEDMREYQTKVVMAMCEMGSPTDLDNGVRYSMDEGELHLVTKIDPGLLSVVLDSMGLAFEGKFFLEGHTTEGVSIWAFDVCEPDSEDDVIPPEDDEDFYDVDGDDSEKPKKKKRNSGAASRVDREDLRRFIWDNSTGLYGKEPTIYLKIPFEKLLEYCPQEQWNDMFFYLALFRCWKPYFSKNKPYPDGAWYVSRPLTKEEQDKKEEQRRTNPSIGRKRETKRGHYPIYLGKKLEYGLLQKITLRCTEYGVKPLATPKKSAREQALGYLLEEPDGVYAVIPCGSFPEYGFIQSWIRDGYCYIQPDGEFYRCGIPLKELVGKCHVGNTIEEKIRSMSFWLEREIQKAGEAEPVEWEEGQTVWMTIKRHRIVDLRDKIIYVLEKPENSIMSAVNVSREANIYPASGCLKVLREMVAAGKLYSYSLGDSANDFAVSLAPIDSGSFPHYTLGQGALLILTTLFDQGEETKCDKDLFLEMPEKGIISNLIKAGRTSVPVSKNVDGKVSRIDVPTDEFVPQQAFALWDKGILVRYDVKGERHWGIPEYFRGQEYFIDSAFKDGKDFPIGIPPFIKIKPTYESLGENNAS